MDCEPSRGTTHPLATGPEDWTVGENAVCGYSEIASRYGFPVTLFVHPETAIAQAAMFRDLEQHGACLGLHMHPWKYSRWRYNGSRYHAHYGGLSEAEQLALLAESSALWQDAIGRRPSYFRPGTFSANDAIFRVLDSLGFKGGSCTAPGRVIPEMCAVWSGAEPDPHLANAVFRQIAGDLSFVNMPLSADRSVLLSGPSGRSMYADLRPDVDWLGQYQTSYKKIATNIVSQVLKRDPDVPVLNTISHNQYAYRDSGDPVYQRLQRMLDEVCAACSAANLEPVGVTLSDITNAVLLAPKRDIPFALEGAIFDKK